MVSDIEGMIEGRGKAAQPAEEIPSLYNGYRSQDLSWNIQLSLPCLQDCSQIKGSAT